MTLLSAFLYKVLEHIHNKFLDEVKLIKYLRKSKINVWEKYAEK